MAKVLITTVPFGSISRLPLEMLDNSGIKYLINPLNKKLTEDQLAEMVTDFDVIIAGTEPITEKVIKRASHLKLISRVGIGLDNVDLNAALNRGIKVSYTPNAPSKAVVELTLCHMLTLLRSVHLSNSQMHNGKWNRFLGKRIENVTLGIIGLGRIGTQLIKILKGFGETRILVNDLEYKSVLDQEFNLEWRNKEEIYKEADIVSLHLPLTHLTKNMIRKENLLTMKSNAMIINTSRGGIINEYDLYDVMNSGHLSGAAIDVFEKEPYNGPLKEIERCLLTAHMGSMSEDCRKNMEVESTKEAISFLKNNILKSEVPLEEYDLQKQCL